LAQQFLLRLEAHVLQHGRDGDPDFHTGLVWKLNTARFMRASPAGSEMYRALSESTTR
jgi:hypothetical protein